MQRLVKDKFQHGNGAQLILQSHENHGEGEWGSEAPFLLQVCQIILTWDCTS